MDAFRFVHAHCDKLDDGSGGLDFAPLTLVPYRESYISFPDPQTNPIVVRIYPTSPMRVEVVDPDSDYPLTVWASTVIPVDATFGALLQYSKPSPSNASIVFYLHIMGSTNPTSHIVALDYNLADKTITMIDRDAPYDVGQSSFEAHASLSMADHCVVQKVTTWGTVIHADSARSKNRYLRFFNPLVAEMSNYIAPGVRPGLSESYTDLNPDAPHLWPDLSTLIISSVVHDGYLYTYRANGCVYRQRSYQKFHFDPSYAGGSPYDFDPSYTVTQVADLRRDDSGMFSDWEVPQHTEIVGPGSAKLVLPSSYAAHFNPYCMGARLTVTTGSSTHLITVKKAVVVGSYVYIYGDGPVVDVKEWYNPPELFEPSYYRTSVQMSFRLTMAHGIPDPDRSSEGCVGIARWHRHNSSLYLLVAGRSALSNYRDPSRPITRLYNLSSGGVTYFTNEGRYDVWMLLSIVDPWGVLHCFWYDKTAGNSRYSRYLLNSSLGGTYNYEELVLPSATVSSMKAYQWGCVVSLFNANGRVALGVTRTDINPITGVASLTFYAFCTTPGIYSVSIETKVDGSWTTAQPVDPFYSFTCRATPEGYLNVFEHAYLSQIPGIVGAPEYRLSMTA